MLRSRKSRIMVMLITAVLLLPDMARLSHGRMIPDLGAMEGDGGSPPAKGGYMSRLQAAPSASGQHLGDGYSRSMHAVSKRLVPQGPNPLHN
uniref:Uncharacterized protein n=1 Tax=Oryza brachyantha TaxID=4533 RepID=J3N3V4_ORYBR